jgi:hypothetical protein
VRGIILNLHQASFLQAVYDYLNILARCAALASNSRHCMRPVSAKRLKDSAHTAGKALFTASRREATPQPNGQRTCFDEDCFNLANVR